MRTAALALSATLATLAALPTRAAADPVDVGSLEAELQAPQSSRRMRAARELVSLDAGRAEPLVRRALADSDADVRAAAVGVTGQLGLTDLCAELRALATSPEPRLREAVSVALGLLRPDDASEVRAIERLLLRALADPEPAVRLAALHSLAERPVRPADRAARLDALAAVLGDERPELRRAAAETLERLADPGALHALAAHVDDASPEVRLAVAHALGALGDPRAAAAVLRLADDHTEEVRAAAITALGALTAAIAVPRLAPLLDHPRDPMAGPAAVALGRMAGGTRAGDDTTTTTLRARAGEALVAAYRRGDNRAAVLEGLRASGSAAAALLGPLLPALGPRPPDELLLVAADLAAAGDDAMVRVLLERARLATDSRFDAALTAARPAPGPTRDRLVLWLAERLSDPGAAARRAAADALGALGDARATRALEALSADPDPATRRAGLSALARVGGDAEPQLIAAARSSDGDLARTAVAALGRRRNDAARQVLVALVGGSDAATQHAAALALAGDADATIAVKPLLAMLRGGPKRDHEAAALALAGPLRRRVDPIAREVCLGIAAGDDPGAAGALELLGEMRDRAAAERVVSLIAHLGKKPLRRTRAYAVLGDLALGSGGASSAALERGLLAGLDDPDPLARASAAWALGKAPRDHAIESTLSQRLADPSPAVRVNALGALARLGAPPSAAALHRLAQDREPGVRANAARLGAAIPPTTAPLPLVARARSSAGHGAPRPGDDYLFLRIVDDAPTATRTPAVRVGLPDGLVEVVAVDERGIARDEGVPKGTLSVDADGSLLR